MSRIKGIDIVSIFIFCRSYPQIAFIEEIMS